MVTARLPDPQPEGLPGPVGFAAQRESGAHAAACSPPGDRAGSTRACCPPTWTWLRRVPRLYGPWSDMGLHHGPPGSSGPPEGRRRTTDRERRTGNRRPPARPFRRLRPPLSKPSTRLQHDRNGIGIAHLHQSLRSACDLDATRACTTLRGRLPVSVQLQERGPDGNWRPGLRIDRPRGVHYGVLRLSFDSSLVHISIRVHPGVRASAEVASSELRPLGAVACEPTEDTLEEESKEHFQEWCTSDATVVPPRALLSPQRSLLEPLARPPMPPPPTGRGSTASRARRGSPRRRRSERGHPSSGRSRHCDERGRAWPHTAIAAFTRPERPEAPAPSTDSSRLLPPA